MSALKFSALRKIPPKFPTNLFRSRSIGSGKMIEKAIDRLLNREIDKAGAMKILEPMIRTDYVSEYAKIDHSRSRFSGGDFFRREICRTRQGNYSVDGRAKEIVPIRSSSDRCQQTQRGKMGSAEAHRRNRVFPGRQIGSSFGRKAWRKYRHCVRSMRWHL
mmetsp:Transcript_7679/g.11551  ORF Transcript_7679/g.11551 Transcript_7679/m.11551 type:complete len:161 (+) Transcript_7679:31-513(+)